MTGCWCDDCVTMKGTIKVIKEKTVHDIPHVQSPCKKRSTEIADRKLFETNEMDEGKAKMILIGLMTFRR